MVEMMLMQNAQMHQIIMQNMMLKALPPMAMSQPGGGAPPAHTPTPQDSHLAGPLVLRPEKLRSASVHHHHHYSPQGHPHAQPTMQPGPSYPMWPQMMASNPMGQMGGFPNTVHHVTGPTTTLPNLHTIPSGL
ncbi:uncharacterized protein C21orf58 homolog, partial [Discoglossus pictus]